MRFLSLSKARAVIELVEMPGPQRKAKTVPELVAGTEPRPFRFGDAI